MTRLLVGDALEQLATLPDESVHCCITSPPYWGLRSYLPSDSPDKALELGAEKAPEEYVSRLVDVFSEVRRVLRSDGVCWLNLGDSYAASGKSGGGRQGESWEVAGPTPTGPNGGRWSPPPPGLKPKDLCLIPYRVALALQSDGWYLRSHVIWAKGVSFCEHYSGSVMPESVRDRPTSAHEAVFLLTKTARYWYDADAVRERDCGHGSGNGFRRENRASAGRDDSSKPWESGTGRNIRNVWAISPRPYSGSHYAVFPPQLVAPMLKAGCPAKVCAECGAPWVREVERGESSWEARKAAGAPARYGSEGQGATAGNERGVAALKPQGASGSGLGWAASRRTIGFRPSCDCNADTLPGVTLDPFIGSGTVAQVAQDHGRRWIGIDLDPRNERLIHKRTAQQSLLGRAR